MVVFAPIGTIPVSHCFREFFEIAPGTKNITIALPEDLARWLRAKAAEEDRSVSRWLAELLDGMRLSEDGYEGAMRGYLEMKPRKLDWPGGRRPTREELHDRPGHKRFA